MRIVFRARNLLAEFRRKLAMDGRAMNARLLEQPAVQHGHDAAAAIVFAGPWGLLEAACGCRTRRFIFKLFELGNNPVPQGFKPEAGGIFLAFDSGHCG